MSAAVPLATLLEYSDHERRKWRQWTAADPRRFGLPYQAGTRFPTIESLFDHIFLVERRHLSRLEGGTPPDATGVRPCDWQALFDYADLVRSDLRKYVADLDDEEARHTMTIVIRSGTPHTMTRLELATHILLHEIRHLAQIACAARLAGQPPPGEHDYFYFVGK